MRIIYFYSFYILILFSCGTSSLYVDVQQPAQITVSKDIQNVVVANRSIPDKKNLAGNIVEGIITGEGIGADKKGSEYCIEGLSSILSSNDRYNLKNAGDLLLKGTGTSEFPPILNWTEVRDICKSYDADALIVLSTFDSDSREIEGKSVVRTKRVKGAKLREVVYPVTLIMEIKSGWRIYDVNNEKIIDVNTFTEVKEFKEWGSSYSNARSRLPSKRQALKRSGVFAGQQYAKRISPTWIKVVRYYFTGNHDDFKLAKKYVKLQQWDKAINLWKNLISNNDIKVSRRAYYNLALAAEIKGHLETAIEYAEKSLDLGEKRAQTYLRALQIRKKNNDILDKQLNN